MTAAPTKRTIMAMTLLLGLSLLLASVSPASAACHIAAFDGETFDTAEGEMVEIVVFLQGRQPSCEGTVDYSTEDGTATAGDDYEPVEGKLTFVEGDDREETITIQVLADDQDEGAEDFRVMLTGGTDGISASSGVATVTVFDDATVTDDLPAETEEGAESQAQVANEGQTSGGGFNTTPIIIAVIALAVLSGAAFILTRGRGTP